ncbi:lamin tail domain-containing protein 1 isoform X2 [Mastomys coucha]|uniref:lamin tail domain-containing protein 1 isoform X2 n=1 Tax=Mastomys coucha TaxID=35658 RepID=UPI00126226E7|nr:lamin tail domain-containing protein 1 isoform X2 [Mastomys coucha]XP_031239736.1 lamin tail domain-containing protein 1 isoform X2 [Mastomys coucha]XP_031239737.1 lamin tail domain-containing protein 1 isoform X2 [Mastomys coucha]XP_031239738.1 lamin tail domain-containing protein 1 isoform X2 [Mastomys coucha]
MSHLVSSHLVQKSSLARPKRKADGPSSKDTNFWAPVMHIVGSEHSFESLYEQSSGFGYPGTPAQQAAVSFLKRGILRKEEKLGIIDPSKQLSSVHFFPKVLDSSSATLVPLSYSFSQEIPIGFYQIPRAQNSSFTSSSRGPLTSKSTVRSCSHKDSSLGKQSTSFMIPRRRPQPSLDLQDTHVFGDGEDYFLSLFGESKKVTARSSQAEEVSKHLSVILEEVGQFTSSSLGDIKIAEVNVKGFFVRLVNSSNEKEVEIGNHILQQNVKGHAVSLYQFPDNITLQASSMVTVWAAASEAKPQPPTDFVWEEQSKFRSNPDCTTILCKPNGEAIAWYTPIHWKQAWEKLETDIEFERCSVVSPSMRSHMFGWTAASMSPISKEKEEPRQKMPSQVCSVLMREEEIPPTILPNKSPWCCSPNTSPHPNSSLIDSCDSDISESNLGSQLKPPPSTKPKPDPGTKKKKSKS